MKHWIVKTGIFFLLVFGWMPGLLLAQMENLAFRKATVGRMDKLSDGYHVVRNLPDGFNTVEEGRGWVLGYNWDRRSRTESWKKSSTRAACVAVVFQSEDKQCEVYYDIFSHDTRFLPPDSIYNTLPSSMFYTQKSLIHREFIRRILRVGLDGRDDFRFEDYVTVIGGQMPREYFHADSVFFWNFPIESTELDGATYTECTYMYIQRQGRVGLVFAWFFTDEGRGRKWHYMDKLRGYVWYKDKSE